MDTDSSAESLMEDLKFTQLVKEVSGGGPCPSSPAVSADTPRRVDIRAIRGNRHTYTAAVVNLSL